MIETVAPAIVPGPGANHFKNVCVAVQLRAAVGPGWRGRSNVTTIRFVPIENVAAIGSGGLCGSEKVDLSEFAQSPIATGDPRTDPDTLTFSERPDGRDHGGPGGRARSRDRGE